MSLRDVIQKGSNQLGEYENTKAIIARNTGEHSRLKQLLHARLLDQLDLDVIEKMTEVDLKAHLKKSVEKIRSQKYKDAKAKIDKERFYKLTDAVKLVKEASKFGIKTSDMLRRIIDKYFDEPKEEQLKK
jgi:hypothetical protein